MLTGISKTRTAFAADAKCIDGRDGTTKTNMTTKLTQSGHATRRPLHRGSRRRATILVLVMAVLGLLFVSGVAFMATMNFESSIISSERLRNQASPAMDQVVADTSNLISDIADPISGIASSNSLTGGAAAYVQLPGVHNLAAPIDPYLENGRMFWPWATDLEAIQTQPFTGSTFKMSRAGDPIAPSEVRLLALAVLEKPGYDAVVGQEGDTLDSDMDGFADSLLPNRRTLVDADGDGIVDAVEVDLAKVAGGNKRRLAGLARILNPASKPSGTVNLGLRVVSHNGMVNVNASHPLLISNVLGQLNNLDPPYSPTVEEPSLRRRHFLPPETLALTQLQGSRFSRDPITADGQFATELFPAGETPRDHRYWPFGPQEQGPDPSQPLWWLRMNADGADPDPSKDDYDRRHLVTTISHSDLLRRPAIVGPANAKKDLIDRLIQQHPNDAVTRFPLLAYPFGDTTEITATTDCISGVTPNCTLDPRKGRIKLSLAWLDQAMAKGDISFDDRTLLIQDAFTLLLLDARGSAWGIYESADAANPMEKNTIWKPNYGAISLTAASLTANMIDFSDTDDLPTEVAIRVADPDDPNFGFALPAGGVVFGLEAQPFITEVVADADGQDDGDNDGKLSANEVVSGGNSFFGIELFNPFNKLLMLDDFTLNVAGTTISFPAGEQLPPQTFKAFHSGFKPTGVGTSTDFGTSSTFLFEEGDSIVLVRPTGSLSGAVVDVKVDSFLTGGDVGKLDAGLLSLQRVASVNAINSWYAPVPLESFSLSSTTNVTLGSPNFGQPEGAPVELIFPDMPDNTLSTAFPTTGMMLMLMRHANSTTKAFTEELNNNPAELDIGGSTPTDNGRMPIYDETMADANGYHAHHINPNWDYTKMDTSGTGIPPAGIQGTAGQAGGAMHLPWGQFVFDFFTAIPLDSKGPLDTSSGSLVIDEDAAPKVDMGGLRVHGQIDLNTAPWKVLEGLPLISKIKMPPPFDDRFETTLNLVGSDPLLPNPIGDVLAKSIVAYRELRELGMAPNSTDDYAAPGISVSRGWSDTAPAMRRGTGFMTIGELANVRHLGAAPEYRTDSGVFNNQVDVRSYVDSIAVLASLGDWLTVRPHVFTVYGTLRGEKDRTITDPNPGVIEDMRVRDIDSRALRFQETVDRLPSLLNEPVRTIGPRVIGKYHDTRGD